MKSFSLTSLLALIIVCAISCTKNDTYDPNELSTGSLSVVTSGACKDFVPHGFFEKDSTFNEENYIDVFIVATTSGQYNISSNTVNGVVFKGAGRIGAEGTNKVRLYGSGKPLQNGTFPFRVSYSGRVCVADIMFGNGSSTANAVFTLGGAPNTCAGFTVSGTYKAAAAIQAGTNTALCEVFVQNIGQYNISTATVNGFSFRGQGSFTAPGLQSIILFATGTPTTAGTSNFSLSTNGTTCGFPVAVQ